MKKITTIGIDLAKNVFHLHGVDEHGKVVLRKKLMRDQVLPFLATLSPCLIGMEACGGSNYWARKIKELGHDARLINPKFVKAYVKSNKNDYNDAEGICEAVSRPSMRFVPIKTVDQLDMQALHRVRSQLIKERTGIVNQVRGLLGEFGIVIPKGIEYARKNLPDILEDQTNELTEFGLKLFRDLYERLIELDDRISKMDQEIKTLFNADETCQRIHALEGVGPLIATAIIAMVGNFNEFKNGRDLSAWLGLVPRQHSTGGKELLLGISKRGNRYLRTMLIHGARSVVYRAAKKDDPKSRWINALKARRGENVACVAVANKNARIIWALITNGTEYQKAV
ncbi:MAG: IS110 family transposase [Nitrospinae bacterium]|nr:IS110 family transposase [Nitrospinota bacterium]